MFFVVSFVCVALCFVCLCVWFYNCCLFVCFCLFVFVCLLVLCLLNDLPGGVVLVF